MQREIAPPLSWRKSWVGIGWDLCATPRATVTCAVIVLLVAVGAIVEQGVVPLLTFHSASEYQLWNTEMEIVISPHVRVG